MERQLISRRNFLKIGVGLAGTAPLAAMATRVWAQSVQQMTPAPKPFGRAITTVVVRELATTKSKALRRIARNDVFEVQGQVVGNGPTAYNSNWYRVEDGFVHSGMVQPVDRVLNPALQDVPEAGAWGEVTVPSILARRAPSDNAVGVLRHYYGNVFRILSETAGPDGSTWYRVVDGDGGRGLYVRAEGVRPIPGAEFEPISPEVAPDDKRIDVNLRAQTMTAYEGDTPVHSARVATGRSPYATPRGSYRIRLKIPGQRMTGGSAGDGSFYDLPGISWVSYFTPSGIAFHGTYWHNDFGAPRSHGCVNLLPDDARWVFRWTAPEAASTSRGFTRVSRGARGTLVRVL